MADGSNQGSKHVEKAKSEIEAADRLMSLASLVEHKSLRRSQSGGETSYTSSIAPTTYQSMPFSRLKSGNFYENGSGRGSTAFTSSSRDNYSESESSHGAQEEGSENAFIKKEEVVGNCIGEATGGPSSSSHNGEASREYQAAEGGDESQRSYFVKHDYRDHARIRLEDLVPVEDSIPITQRCNRGGVKMLFPEKLHQLLSMSPDIVSPAVISWAPHGRCFSVHNTREFTRELMPKYFNHNAITSFQRQLNLYGFKRITRAGSKDQGAYYHELFLRGRPALCRRMRRQKIKGTGYKPLPDPDNEPDFYSMPPCWDILEDFEENEPRYQQRTLTENSSHTPMYVPMKREMEDSDSILSMDRKFARLRSESDWNVYGNANLTNRETPIETARRLSMLGAMQGNMRRISLPERMNNIGVSQPVGAVGAVINRRGSMPISSGRETNSTGAKTCRFGEPKGQILSDVGGSSHLSMSGRESLLQELMSRARGSSDAAGSLLATELPQDALIRNEMDKLEHTRRNIVMQQERLQMLMHQVHTSRRSSMGMGTDFTTSASGMGNFGSISGEVERRASLAGRNIGEMERRASLLAAGRMPVVEPRQTIGGGMESYGAAARSSGFNGMMPLGMSGLSSHGDNSWRGIGPDGDNGESASAVYNSLASMVSSGRFTNAQLDEIEMLLKTGRNKASS